MLLGVILSVLCIIQVANYLLKNHNKRKANGDDRKPQGKLSFIQSIPVLLAFLLNNRIPNYELTKKWSEIYGKIMTFELPFKQRVTVIMTDLEISKQIMSSSAWSDRLHNGHYIHRWSFGKPLGLLFGNGGYWKEARKLTIKILHQLDFYRQENIEKFINFELLDFEEKLREAVKDGDGTAIITMRKRFEVYTLNVVLQVILGKRLQRGDPLAEKLMALIIAGNKELNVGTSILEVFPWLLRVPFLNMMKHFNAANSFVCDYLKRELLEPKRKAKTYAENPIDFVDFFLLEIDRRAHETPRYLTDENLLITVRDLVFAGADTTNSLLEHGILHVSLNTLIQRKVQDEIDQIVGARQPTYDDRHSMPYTQAVLQELLRISTPIPATARCPLGDNEINGNPIPKGSLIAINLYAIHRDVELWEDPEEFQPERFLNEKKELINLDKIIPFGWGKRVCLGETVARISSFLFFVMLMQKFSFRISKDHPPPSMQNPIGMSRAPIPYYVTVKCRKFE